VPSRAHPALRWDDQLGGDTKGIDDDQLFCPGEGTQPFCLAIQCRITWEAKKPPIMRAVTNMLIPITVFNGLGEKSNKIFIPPTEINEQIKTQRK